MTGRHMERPDPDDFQTDIDDAVQAAIAEVCQQHGRMAGPFIGITRFLFDDGDTGTCMFWPEDQVLIESLGLVTFLKMRIDAHAMQPNPYNTDPD